MPSVGAPWQTRGAVTVRGALDGCVELAAATEAIRKHFAGPGGEGLLLCRPDGFVLSRNRGAEQPSICDRRVLPIEGGIMLLLPRAELEDCVRSVVQKLVGRGTPLTPSEPRFRYSPSGGPGAWNDAGGEHAVAVVGFGKSDQRIRVARGSEFAAWRSDIGRKREAAARTRLLAPRDVSVFAGPVAIRAIRSGGLYGAFAY